VIYIANIRLAGFTGLDTWMKGFFKDKSTSWKKGIT
jgi:hypothetical protein